MTDPAEIARYTIASALELMADKGVTDEIAARELMAVAVTLGQTQPHAVDVEDVVRFALVLVGAHRGGPEGIADWAEELAASIRDDPNTPPPTRLN